MSTLYEQITINPLFDRLYYLSKYKDVQESGIDPVLHYCTIGWHEGRNPNSAFDTKYYLAANPDVRNADLNPFWHYISSGKAEGRLPKLPKHALDVPRAQIALSWQLPVGAPIPVQLGIETSLSLTMLLDLLARAMPRQTLAVAISHDDYGVSIGGVQNIVSEECKAFNARGTGFLHVCSSNFVPALSEETDLNEFVFALRLNGKAIGRATADVLNQTLQFLRKSHAELFFIVHHLMGHSVEIVSALARSAQAVEPLFWAHDYYAGCGSYTLMRNNVSYCGAPAIGSAGCRVCIHGATRQTHTACIQKLISANAMSVVAPSQAALEQWIAAVGLQPKKSHVTHPAKLFLKKNKRHAPVDRPLRIAFVGAPVHHKGWTVFKYLAEELSFSNEYSFFHLGEPHEENDLIKNVPVHVTASNPNLMIDTVFQNEIDAVVSWSQWPETFNFAVHEAVAGGAFIVARRIAGHVLPAVQLYAPQSLHEVSSQDELVRYFASGQAAQDIRSSPQLRGVMVRSMGSAELVGLDVVEELVA